MSLGASRGNSPSTPPSNGTPPPTGPVLKTLDNFDRAYANRVMILLAILVVVLIRESSYRRPETRVDYVGAALLGGALRA